MSSIEPSKPVTNQVKPTHQMNNNGGGLGGGSSSSYKNKQKKKQEEDAFTSSDELDKEVNQELLDKSILVLFKEFILAMINSVLVALGLRKETTEEINDKEKPL